MTSTRKNIRNNLFLGVVLLLATLVVISCNDYTSEELILALNQDQSYTQSSQSDLCTYSLQWLPKEYLAAMEIKSQKQSSDSMIQNKIKAYDKSYYFKLSLNLNSGDNAMLQDIKNVQEYSQKWNYLTYGMGKNLYLITAKYDTIYPNFYTFQNPHIYNNRLSFLYVFEKGKLDNEDKILRVKYKDELFSDKTISFDFEDFRGLTKKNYNLTFKN